MSDPEKIPPQDPVELPEKPMGRKRRWRRWFRVVLLLALFLIVAFRLTLNWTLPLALSRAASAYNFDIAYDHDHIDMIGGDVGLWNLRLLPKGGGEPLFVADYVRGDISTVALLRGQLRVMRAEADGVNVVLERTADGEIPILQRLMSGPATTAATRPAAVAQPASETPVAAPAPIDFTPPLTIEAIRLSRVTARVRDAYVKPGLDATVEMTLRVSDIGVVGNPLKLEADVWADGLIDALHVVGEGKVGGQTVDAKLNVALRGLHPKPLSAYLAQAGVRPIANSISGGFNVAVSAGPLGSAGGATRPTTGPTTADARGGGVATTLLVEGAKLVADGGEPLAVGRLKLDVAEIKPNSVRVDTLLLEGVRANAARTAGGTLRAAGFETVNHAAGQDVAPVVTMTAPPASPPAAEHRVAVTPATPSPVTVRQVLIRDVDARLRDEAVAPAADLAVTVRELSCTARTASVLGPDAVLDLDGTIALRGLARSVRLSGSARPFADVKSAEVTVRAEGVRPDAIQPYLDALGVQSLLSDAVFTAKVAGSLKAADDGGPAMVLNAKLADVAIADGKDLLTFAGVDVRDASIDPAGAAYRVSSIDIVGPAFELTRTRDGALETSGLRLLSNAAQRQVAVAAPAAASAPDVPAASVPPAPPVEAASQPAASLPRVQIDRLTWKGVRLALKDESADRSPSSFVIRDAGVELADLTVDFRPRGSSSAKAAKPGTFKMWLASPELADELVLQGALTPGDRSLAAELQLRGRRVDLTRLAPYLQPLGVEPVMTRGGLDASLKATVSNDDGGLRGAVDIADVNITDGDDELVGVATLSVKDAVSSNDGGLSVGSVEVRRPRAKLVREADGAFVVAGMRMRTPAPATGVPQPPTTAVGVSAPEPAIPATTKADVAPTPVVNLTRFLVDDGELRWEDYSVDPPVKVDARAAVQVDGVSVGRAAPPATFNAKLSAADVADAVDVIGKVDLSPGAPAASLHVEATGLRAGPLAAYVPSGVEVDLRDGRFRANVDAAISENPAGGQGLKLSVANVDFRDGDATTPLLGLKSFTVDAPRVDLPNDVIAIDEVSMTGFETGVRRNTTGGTNLLGLVLTPPAAASPPPTRVEPPAAAPATAPAAAAPALPMPAADAEREIARLVADARRPLPLFTLEKLDLGVSRIEWLDESVAGAKALTVRDLRLRSLVPVAVGGPKAESLPPVKLELTAAAEPAAKQVVLNVEAAPFATEPVAKLDLKVGGISGRALTDLRPDLATAIDGGALTDGRLAATVEAHAKFDRRGPRDFDLSRGFQVDFAVAGPKLTDGPSGVVLAGVESIQCDALRVEPKTGQVHAKVLEVNKPIATGSRDADGLHLLGLVFKAAAAPATQPTTSPASTLPAATQPIIAAAPAATSTAPTTARSPSPSGEIAVDRLLVTGIDVRFEDKAAKPGLVVPLNNLDVEVRDFTTLALTEPRPVRFSVVVGADKVELPKHAKGAGIAGAFGDAASLLGGKKAEEMKTEPQVEKRELFSQITAAGNLALYPAPTGYVKTSVSGFELASLGGIASQFGVNVSGGAFDSSVEAFFRDDGSLDTRSRFVFTDLAVEEPPNGPIVRHLALPAPLDAVLAALRDADGSITVPLNVPVAKGNVNAGAVTGSAVGAFGGIVVTAIASAPVKIVGGVGDVLGLGALGLGGDKSKAVAPVELAFGAGDATLSADDERNIAALARMMRKDDTVELTARHELGAADVAMAKVRANPTREDALTLAEGMQARRTLLVSARRDLATRARAELASLPDEQTRATLAELRALDREIAAADDASDLLYDMLRPGAERQELRRTRTASLQIAQQRLSVVRDALNAATTAAGVPLSAERVRTTNPQFNVAEGEADGRVVITVVRKKRQ